jgi:hypothetical protein
MEITAEERTTLQWLRDRAEIGDVMRRYATGADGRAIALMHTVFMPEAEFDFVGMAAFRGMDAFVEFFEATLFRMLMTQHIISNDVIQVEGDRATASYYAHAARTVASPEGDVLAVAGCRYDQELVRTADGWRITKHVCTPLWSDDSRSGQPTGAGVPR